MINRRFFLHGSTAAGMAALPDVLSANQSIRQQLSVIIVGLENAPSYQTGIEHMVKAHIAGQLRMCLGQKVPPNENREWYLSFDRRALDDDQSREALRLSRNFTAV